MDRARTALRPDGVLSDRRTAGEVGRRASLKLRFAVRGGRTVVADAYAEPPYRIPPPFERDGELHLIMAMSAPGVFGGDELSQHIVVEPGARVRLTSQSAQQVHAAPDPQPACITSRFEVGESASLICHWDPVIPFPAARIENRVAIAVAAGGRLLWSDALMAGREARGERWQFARIDHELALRREGRLAFLERYRLTPDAAPLAVPWLADVHSYFGTTLVLSADLDRVAAEAVHERGVAHEGTMVAADCLEPGLLLLRFAGSGAPFHRARQAALEMFHPVSLSPRALRI